MRRSRTSSYGFSFRQLLHPCRKPIVSDNGGGGCSCQETELLRGPKVACEKKGMRSAGALDNTPAFFEEQIAWLNGWLNALSLGAVQCNGKVLGYINLFVRRLVVELGQRLSWLGKLQHLKSWRSSPRASQHPVTFRNCMLWEADLQRIANHETDAIPQALIGEQVVFRCVRFSLSRSEGWHRSGRLVKVRSNRSRIPLLFSPQRLSQDLQTIEAFEAMPSGRNCIRFEWQRCARVLQAQCRKQWQRGMKPFSERSFARLPLG